MKSEETRSLRRFLFNKRPNKAIAFSAAATLVLIAAVVSAIVWERTSDVPPSAGQTPSTTAIPLAVDSLELRDVRAAGNASIALAERFAASTADESARAALAEAVRQLQTTLESDDASSIQTDTGQMLDILTQSNLVLGDRDDTYLKALDDQGAMYFSSDGAAIRAAMAYCAIVGGGLSTSLDSAARLVIENRTLFFLPAVTAYCPEAMPAIERARSGFGDDTVQVASSAVPFDAAGEIVVAEGTYETTHTAKDCRIHEQDANGDPVDVPSATSADGSRTISIRTGETVVSEGCGVWLRG